MTLIAAQAPIARPPNGEAASYEAAVNRPDLAPDKTAVMGPPVPGRRPVPGNDIGHPADVPKAASQSGSRYAIQTHDPHRAAAGSVPLNLDTTLVNVALPALVRELHATTTQLQWVVDSYNLVFAAPLLTFGSLSDRFGRKGMLLAGLAVVGGASLAGGFTTSPAQLIAARSVMGLGAAMTFPATLSLISNVFTERRERARAIGLWGAIAGVAIAMGPIVGAWLLEHFSWAGIFIAMAPVAAAAAILVALVVPASRDPEAAALDVPGLVLSSATMALLVFTIIEAPAYGWAGGRSLAGFAASAVLLAAFIARERRAAHPMLDVRLFRNLRFSAASGAVTVSFFTLFGFIFLMTQYFQFVRGYGPLSTGVHLLPVALSVGAGSVAGTALAVRAGTKLIVTVNGPQTWQLTEETTVKRIRIDRPRIRREQPWPEDLPPDPRDPDVVRAKVWPLNVGQVYTTLQRLERDGLVESDDASEDGREKTQQNIFRITAEGQQELVGWLRTPPDLSAPPRDELIMKVLVAMRVPGTDVPEVIQVHRRYLVELMQQWTRIKEAEAESDLSLALVVDAELFRLDAVIRWLDAADGRIKRAAPGSPGEPSAAALPRVPRRRGTAIAR